MRVDIQRADGSSEQAAIAIIREYCEAIQVVVRDTDYDLRHYIRDTGCGVWLAWAENSVVGCIVLRPLPEIPDAGEVKRLYVRPAYRGYGAASGLLRCLEEFAAACGVRWLYLDTKDDLHEAIGFYKRHGYTPCERYNENPQATIFMRKQMTSSVSIRRFRSGDEDAFRSLNEHWIEKYFQIEEMDRVVLGDPQGSILDHGGEIFIAEKAGVIVGCCALKPDEKGRWEVSKMAVAETEQGRGIGRRLLEAVVGHARALKLPSIYLETNDRLETALRMYEAAGFKRVPDLLAEPSPYARSNVAMTLALVD